MGITGKLPFISSFLLYFFILQLSAQKEVNVDLQHIYNTWALSIQESENDILVYVDENDLYFENIPYNVDDNLKFKRRNNVFYIRFSGSKKKYVRCGNYIPKPTIKANVWTKGIWNIKNEGEAILLVLDYFVAEKGKKYELTSQIVYEIDYLEEDKMILRKLENDI